MTHRRRRLIALLLVTVGWSASAASIAAAQPAAGPVAGPTAGTIAGPVAGAGDRTHVHEWWYDKMRLAEAHRISTGKGVTVAIIDTGLNTSIPELRGADVTFGHICRSRVQKERSRTGPVADHGTAMTTLIVGNGRGSGPGGQGILGIAPDAHILFYPNDLDGLVSAVIDCDEQEMGREIVDAARQGADIISLSFHAGPSMNPYVRKAINLGAVVVAAAGDAREGINGWVQFPAGMPGVVAVEAVDEQANPWKHNPVPIMIDGKYHAAAPTVAAPGVDVSDVGLGDVTGTWTSQVTRTGTSDSTAIVSGALALVKSKYPRATGNQLIQQLIHHTGGTPGRYTWDTTYGYGIVSATEMLATDPTGWPDENPLLRGPPAALRNYPLRSYGRAERASAASATSSPSATSTTSSGSSATATPAASGGASGGGDASGGVPAWSWVAGIALLLAAAAAFMVRSTGRRWHSPGRSQT